MNVIAQLVENVFKNFSSPGTKDSCGIKFQKFLIPKCDFPPPGAWTVANTIIIPKPSKFDRKSTGYKRRKKKMTCIRLHFCYGNIYKHVNAAVVNVFKNRTSFLTDQPEATSFEVSVLNAFIPQKYFHGVLISSR